MSRLRPFHVEHVVRPGLDADVHDLPFDSRQGPVDVWVFVTRGLARLGHRELVVAVRRRPGESRERIPGDVWKFLRGVHGAAERGQTVGVGGRTSFESGSSRFLDRTDIAAAIYTWVPPVLGDVAPQDALLAVFLTGGEMGVAETFGHGRVLALLGESVRFYPTMFWFDRDRAEVAAPAQMEESLLGKLPRIQLGRTAAFTTVGYADRKVTGVQDGLADFEGTWRDGPAVLRLDPADLPRLASAMAQLPPDQPFALLTSTPPDAPRCFVWNSERQSLGQASAISDYARREDPRCAANFVLFVGGQSSNGSRGLEDGLGFLLTDAEMSHVHRALAAGESLEVRDSAGAALLWIQPVR